MLILSKIVFGAATLILLGFATAELWYSALSIYVKFFAVLGMIYTALNMAAQTIQAETVKEVFWPKFRAVKILS
jgi:hypothetical protein